MTGMTTTASHAAAHITVFVLIPLQDLTYKVRNNNNRRQKVTLLYKISGFFVPGGAHSPGMALTLTPCRPAFILNMHASLSAPLSHLK